MTVRFDPLAGGPAYGLASKAERVFWGLAWLVLFRISPTPLFGWRRLVLRAFGAQVGRGTRIHASVRVWRPRNLVIGSRSLIGPGVHIYNQGHIKIGDRAVVSQRAHLCASSHDAHDPGFALVERPIALGDACWVAAEAFVGPGVTIGEGALLGARAALFEDAEPLTIYRGNPALAIGRRELPES